MGKEARRGMSANGGVLLFGEHRQQVSPCRQDTTWPNDAVTRVIDESTAEIFWIRWFATSSSLFHPPRFSAPTFLV